MTTQINTKIICDNCKTGLVDFPLKVCVEDYEELAERYDFITIETEDGRKDFCNEECYNEWKERQ